MSSAEIGRRPEDADTPAERLAAIAQALDELPPLRLADMVALRRHGYTLADIAELAGVTRSRVSQLLGPIDALGRRRIHHHRPEEVTPRTPRTRPPTSAPRSPQAIT